MKNHTAVAAANLDDLLFQNRNKNYGAYELRKNYDKRLTAALFAAVSFLLLVIFTLNNLPSPKNLMVFSYYTLILFVFLITFDILYLDQYLSTYI